MAKREIEVNAELEEEFATFLGQNLDWIRKGYSLLLEDIKHLNEDQQLSYISKYINTVIDQEFVKGREIMRFKKISWAEALFKRLEML